MLPQGAILRPAAVSVDKTPWQQVSPCLPGSLNLTVTGAKGNGDGAKGGFCRAGSVTSVTTSSAPLLRGVSASASTAAEVVPLRPLESCGPGCGLRMRIRCSVSRVAGVAVCDDRESRE